MSLTSKMIRLKHVAGYIFTGILGKYKHFIPLYNTVVHVWCSDCFKYRSVHVAQCTAYELLTKEGVDGSISVFMFHLLLSGLLRLLADVDGQPGTDHPEENNQSQTASLQPPPKPSSLLVSRPTGPSVHWRVLYHRRAHRSVWRPPWSASTSLPLVHASSRDTSA